MTKMLRVATTLSLACLVGWGAYGQQGDQPVELIYKWKSGDRHSFAIAAHVQGKVAMLGGELAGQQINVDTTLNLTVFADVLEVQDDGSAKVKLAFGMIGATIQTPQGQTLVARLNPATGEVAVEGPGGQQNVIQKLPEGLREVLANGFTVVLTNRGEVKQVEGLNQLEAALRKVAGAQGGALALNQLVGWIEPPLPDKPVKPGDEWEKPVPWIFGGGQDTAPKQLVMKFRYAGTSNVNGVRCAKLEASMQVSGLDMSVEPGVAGPLGQRISGLSTQLYLTYYLDAETGHLREARGRIMQSGTIRQYGSVELEGREQPIDLTMQFDGLVIELEVKATED